MEAFMPGIVALTTGVLAAGSTGLLLSGEDAGAKSSSKPGGGHAAWGWLASTCRAVGGPLREHVLRILPLRAAMRELREERMTTLVYADGCDERGATGLLALLCLVSAVLGGVVSLSPVGACWGLVAPVVALDALGAQRARRTARNLEEAMPEAFGALAISLGSGHSLAQAMQFVGAHAREPVRSEFTRVSFSITCGIPAAEALDTMLERLAAPGLELVALALKVSQRTGAPLGELLAEASELVGKRIELKRLLDVKTAQARMSARMVAAMPVGMSVLLALLSEDYRRGMLQPAGAAFLILALALNALAWGIIGKIMKVRL